jgi:cytochrome c oxidase subunit I+III
MSQPDHGERQESLRTSALFLLASISVLLIGGARAFVSQFLPVRVPPESAQLALLRLQYVLFGAVIFIVSALCYRWFDRDQTPSQRQRARLGFWLMFLGFNVAFLPTSWRGATPLLVTQPGMLLFGDAGAFPVLGVLAFIGGCVLCLWSLKRRSG